MRGPTSSDENPRWHLATVTDLLPPGTTPPPGSLLCPSPPTLPFALPSLTSAPSLIYCRLSYLPPSNHSPVWANVNSEDICSPYTHNSKINAVKRKGMNVSKPSVSQPRARGGKEDEGGRQVQEKAETGGGYPGARAANAAMSGDIKFGCASDAPSLPSLSLHVRGTPVRPSAVGLRNLGNSCFMNTVLQVICRVRGFREYFAYPYKNDLLNPSNPSSTGGRLATAFSDFLRLFYSNRYAVVSPSRLRSLCSEYSDDLRSSKGQHDAAEFMQQIVFQLLHEDLNTAKGKLEVGGGDDANYQTFPRDVNEQRVEDVKTDASFVTTKFRSYFANRTTCTVCKTESVKYEGFTTLSLAVPFKAGGCSVTLSECIDNFENPESVSGIDCQVCGCRVVKNTRNNIHVCSDVVVVQLKRFSWDGVKNTAPVTFPLSMKLGEQTEHQRGEYGLIGVVNHLGRNLQNGHYTANAIVEGMEWFHFNDEKVTSTSGVLERRQRNSRILPATNPNPNDLPPVRRFACSPIRPFDRLRLTGWNQRRARTRTLTCWFIRGPQREIVGGGGERKRNR